jgi:putative transposase
MKKPYQIESQRAVKQLAEMAAEGNPAVQMVLPLAEMIGWLRKGVGELIRQAGLQLMDLMMQEEVRAMAGEPHQRHAERTATRWGSERGYCVVMGQKVPIQRPRVRNADDKEVRLGSYEMFHRGEPLTETVWEKLMLGLSTRKYGDAVREFTEAYGLEKSAISEHFIEASRAKLKALMERRLDKVRLCAMMVDATPFEGQQMVVALGIGEDGRKTILGIRQGATENTSVVSELLSDLVGARARLRRTAALHSGWRQGAERRGEKACGRVGADPAMPGSQAAQRAGPPNRGTETARRPTTPCRICAGGLRCRQASAGAIAS